MFKQSNLIDGEEDLDAPPDVLAAMHSTVGGRMRGRAEWSNWIGELEASSLATTSEPGLAAILINKNIS